MPANIYVLNHDGTPLMPSHSYGRVKRMLHTGKARIAGTKPFTIRLTYQIDTPAIQPHSWYGSGANKYRELRRRNKR